MNNPIKKILISTLLFSSPLFANSDHIETIIMIRHGEKPFIEIGQLNCRGLNRSLLLPAYFRNHFPKPNYIFAPNPSVQIYSWSGKKYSYIRALATIEPTAISLNMPVNTQIGFNRPDLLAKALLEKKYHSSVIYVAWEHGNIERFARLFLLQFHNNAVIPTWDADNYNMVYVFTINWNKKPADLQFRVTDESFHRISKVCPQ